MLIHKLLRPMWPQGLRTTLFRQRPHTRRPLSTAPSARPAPSGAAGASSGLHGVWTMRRAPPLHTPGTPSLNDPP